MPAGAATVFVIDNDAAVRASIQGLLKSVWEQQRHASPVYAKKTRLPGLADLLSRSTW
jgi:hypothetical protein